MTIREISEMPVVISRGYFDSYGTNGVHESVLRSCGVLDRTKDFLRRGVPADVILELIEEMEHPK